MEIGDLVTTNNRAYGHALYPLHGQIVGLDVCTASGAECYDILLTYGGMLTGCRAHEWELDQCQCQQLGACCPKCRGGNRNGAGLGKVLKRN